MYLSPKLFGQTVCHKLTFESSCKLHDDIYDVLFKKPRYAAIIAPRGFAKTTVTSTIGTLYDLGYDNEDYIILVKKSYSQAIMDLRAIKNQLLHNDRFHFFYGRFIRESWREDYIVVKNPRTGHRTMVQALGFDQEVRGRTFNNKRPTKIVLDDFESKKNTMTPDMRRKLKENVREDYMPSLDPEKGKLLAIGTIVHSDSWLNAIYTSYLEGKLSEQWTVIFHRAIEDNKPLWPERYPIEYLEALKRDYEADGSLDSWYQEYMNVPIADENRQFRNISYMDLPVVVLDGEAFVVEEQYRKYAA